MRQLAQLTFSLGGSSSGIRFNCTVMIPNLMALLGSQVKQWHLAQLRLIGTALPALLTAHPEIEVDEGPAAVKLHVFHSCSIVSLIPGLSWCEKTFS